MLSLAACTHIHDRKEVTFDPAEVSCNVRHIPKTNAVMQMMRKGWLQERRVNEIDTILGGMRDLANQGDPEAMLIWGLAKHKIIIDKFLDSKYSGSTTVPSLDDSRDDMTMAMTYALIALSAGGDDHKALARKLMSEIEYDLAPLVRVPPAWVEEAEANATRWNAHCGRPTPRYERNAEPFRPEEVSCHIHEIPEAHKRIKAVYRHPNGDLYFIGNADVITANMRKFADQGDPESMYFIGYLKREAVMIVLTDVRDTDSAGRTFPDYTKTDMITAMTYIFLSADLEGKHKEKAQKLMQDIESDRQKTLQTPAVWIQEAKANVGQWKARCDRLKATPEQ